MSLTQQITPIVLTALISISTGCHHRAIAKPLTPAKPVSSLSSTTREIVPSLEGRNHVSRLLKESGQAIVGQQMPFFSGWTISEGAGRAYSLRKALKKSRSKYVLSICASWCKPCMKGLDLLSKAREQFSKGDVELIVLVADSSEHGREIHTRFKFDWAHVVVDEFQTFALKLAPNKDNKSGRDSLSLPRTIIFNPQGEVEKIIGREGEDYVSQIFSK